MNNLASRNLTGGILIIYHINWRHCKRHIVLSTKRLTPHPKMLLRLSENAHVLRYPHPPPC